MALTLTVITMLFVGLSAMNAPSAYLQVHDQLQSSQEQQVPHDMQLTLPPFPRKLKVTQVAAVKADGDRDFGVHNKQKETLSGKVAHHGDDVEEANRVHAGRGTWQEWVEGPHHSEFFTMDYSHVRRRRPIHNKSVPVGP